MRSSNALSIFNQHQYSIHDFSLLCQPKMPKGIASMFSQFRFCWEETKDLTNSWYLIDRVLMRSWVLIGVERKLSGYWLNLDETLIYLNVLSGPHKSYSTGTGSSRLFFGIGNIDEQIFKYIFRICVWIRQRKVVWNRQFSVKVLQSSNLVSRFCSHVTYLPALSLNIINVS